MLVSRLILDGVFLGAGATKIANPGGLAYSLAYVEVLLGRCLIAGPFTRPAARAVNALMLVFTVALSPGAASGSTAAASELPTSLPTSG